MKKFTILLILAFMVLGLNGWTQVFITELADPNNNAGVRFIELYNAGASEVDFTEGSNWRIDKYTNASATVSQTLNLNGTIPAGGFYIIATGTDDGDFFTVYGVNADQFDGSDNNVAGSNGDDNLELYDGTNTLIDQFGVPSEDGTGTNHEFEDGRAERKATVTSGNVLWDFSEWNIWNDTGGGGTTNLPQNAPEDFDPGEWIGTSTSPIISLSPSTLSGFVYEFGFGPSGDQSFTVSGSNLTDDVVLTASASYEISETEGSGYTSPITLTQSGGSLSETTIYVRLIAGLAGGDYNEDITVTTIGADPSAVSCNGTVEAPATTTIPYNEPFDTDLGDCYTFSVSGDLEAWYWNGGGFAAMNGYNTGDTEEDWLILPGINMDNYSNETMTFDTWYNFGTDDLNNYLKLYYCDDYSGIGDPSGASWIELPFTQPPSTSTWTSSGTVDLSGITGTSIYIGFKYHYEPGSYRLWNVDNISIVEGNPPLVADFTADQTFITPGTMVSFTDETIGGDGSYSYAWDFGDGIGTSTDQNPTYTYNTVNTYTVELTVTDGNLETDTEIKIDYITVAVNPFGSIVINEVDADQVGTDALEFIELYDGGAGNTDLTGLVVVLFNGSDDQSYNVAIDLDGETTDVNGYFVIGSATVPNVDLVAFTTNGIQNGTDAVALFIGDDTDFPNDTPIPADLTNLLDALVYDTGDSDDPALLVLLNGGQPQINEQGRGDGEGHSNQRILNGSGGQRNTDTYDQSPPTPGEENVLVFADWTGAVSTNWYDDGNWATGSVPTSVDEVVISAGMSNYPIIGFGNPEAECASLYIGFGGMLTIQELAGLNVVGTAKCDGEFVMQSDPFGNSSSFRDGGIDPASTGTFLFDRVIEYYNASDDHLGWHYISSPIAGFDNWDMYNYWINYWNEGATGVDPDFPWVHMEGSEPCIPAPQMAIGDMEGWSIKQDYDYACNSTNPGTDDQILYAGDFADVNSGDFNKDYTAIGGHSATGYNLFGNPYPSYINMTAFAGMNVHIWNSDADDYLDWADGGDFTEIPPTQGFFVYDGGAGNIALTNANRVFGTQAFEKSTSNELVILATGNGKEDKTYIRFSEEATAGYDNAGLDAYKLLGTGTAPQIYTVTNGTEFSINTLAETPIVPMSFFAAQSGEYTISAIETSEFTNVILEDRFWGVQTDLLTDSYTFNYNVNDEADRFFIHFTPLGIGDNIAHSINIWSENHNIHVQAPDVSGDIVVFNMMGQEITRTNIKAGLNVIPVTDVNAFYVVKIVGSEVSKTGKVYVK